VSVEDIVPITKGQLRAFMYENYAKGKEDVANAAIKAIKDRGAQLASLAGIGNAVLLEELLIEMIKDLK